MEIINNNKSRPRRDVTITKAIYFGLVLVAAGIVWLLKNLDIINYNTFTTLFSWQTLLILIGGYLLVIRKWIAGTVISLIGVALLISENFCLDLPIAKIILPVIVIAIGFAVIFSSKK